MTKPTIAQLEELLDRSENSLNRDEQEIEILPNGEIRAKGGGAAEGVKPLTFRENLGGEYGKLAKLAFAALLVFAASISALAQQSDVSLGPAYLTAACTNANTTCDTANTPVQGPNGSVVGPATLEGNTQGYGVVQVTLNGLSTAAGATIFFEFSDDGGTSWYSNTCTRTDLPVQEPSEAIPASTYRAWDCGVGAATRFRVRQSAISSGQTILRATLTAGLLEPAPTPQIAGLKYATISTAANTQIQATPVFLHTVTITNPGATVNSIVIVDTTAGACTGGTTIATIPAAQLASTNAAVTLTFDIETTNGLCITTAGTTSPQLVVTYR